jgi:putative endonuclease
MPYTYIVKCSDGTYYTGWTTNVDERLKTHNAGLGARYTRGRNPVELVYIEEHSDKISAQRREREIKRICRNDKEKLILEKENVLSPKK